MAFQVLSKRIFALLPIFALTLACMVWSQFALSNIEPHPFKSHDHKRWGKLAASQHEDWVWAEVEGKVGAPISEVLGLLYDHETTKSYRIAEMKVRDLTSPHPDASVRHLVHYVVKPFLFVTVEWDVEYTYTILEGTRDNPVQALISYKKTRGTSHIAHLEGDILLTRVSSGKTEINLYEEVKATGRTDQDTARGLEGTLKTIREKIKK